MGLFTRSTLSHDIKIKSLERTIEELKDEKDSLNRELASLKNDKKIAEEDIKHMVKMKEEKNALEFERKVLDNERVKEAAIAKVKDEYRDKLEKRLELEVTNIKEMYGQILERLPNVSMRIKEER